MPDWMPTSRFGQISAEALKKNFPWAMAQFGHDWHVGAYLGMFRITFSEVRRNVSLIPQILVVDGLRDALFPQCMGTF